MAQVSQVILRTLASHSAKGHQRGSLRARRAGCAGGGADGTPRLPETQCARPLQRRGSQLQATAERTRFRRETLRRSRLRQRSAALDRRAPPRDRTGNESPDARPSSAAPHETTASKKTESRAATPSAQTGGCRERKQSRRGRSWSGGVLARGHDSAPLRQNASGARICLAFARSRD